MANLADGSHGDIRPIPDPTQLTVEASIRQEATIRNLIGVEIKHLAELLEKEIDGITGKFQTQFDMLAAHTTEQKQDTTHALDAALAAQKEEFKYQNELFTEKLDRVGTRFNMLDARTAEQKKDTKDALDAALAAQKEAVAAQTASSEKAIIKSETATIERIKSVETLLATSTKAMDDKVSDLKDRVIAMEAKKTGNSEGMDHLRQNGVDSRALLASIISVVMVIIAVASVLIAVLHH